MPSACANAPRDTAVTSTPCTPPISFWITAAGSSFDASTTNAAPSLRASSSFCGATSTATTCSPIAFAYCTATCPSPPIPEIAIHCPGRVSVTRMPL
ncbi:hypothetical protein X962_3263 [Burkholderia pseudomallei MSHR7343]|nr:hypothetical protein X962_3263 [Burkholderia pseudomallei MSHR7343]KGX66182.1 hypothetical protein Y025_6049 [Burkholderia pseudomallei TSV32]